MKPHKTMNNLQQKYDKKYPAADQHSVQTGFITFEPVIWLTVRSIPTMEIIEDLRFDFYGNEICEEEEEQEDPHGLIITEVIELTADEFEEYKLHCENNPMASYDDITSDEFDEFDCLTEYKPEF